MARCIWAAAALAAFLSTPASGAVTVLGSSAARSCYLAADSALNPSWRDLQLCDAALRQEGLNEADTVATHVNRGILKLRRGDTDGAMADFDRAIAIDPDQPESYLNKGAVLIRLQDAQGAVPLFTVALEKNTRRPQLAHYGRAVAYEALGQVPRAYADYRRASELAPDWNDPRQELRRFRVVER